MGLYWLNTGTRGLEIRQTRPSTGGCSGQADKPRWGCLEPPPAASRQLHALTWRAALGDGDVLDGAWSAACDARPYRPQVNQQVSSWVTLRAPG